ncbi:sugar phosphate isomerase/epimerase [Bacillus pacificus]|uniref:sugar phosphate isomerase/epimerase family protein n=1 Tax=Bacillus cereus group TaxID=86661 RepID=UPI0009424564|nr:MULTISPECIES: TIM barrel protein [Bacillus cereus group]MCC2352707.1 sugar phosphate isomerase/epimerase [Bacillus pacificus]MCC2430399.1 sugar phosphate isomerase/epimerase [Bacillus paranthracis]MCC2434590.1 sugar phosphate isomerase/epimerase [Bacillus paranthracis]MCC2445654.1 sugar phosphate isomerase/epimerase [Bacillus cereus]MCC2468190.1 sugar phosphate isomerase/epimerase [Bacillus pacificus]
MKAKLTINLDEISSNIDSSFTFLKEMDLHTCELRMINNKNLSLMNKNEILDFANKLKSSGITPVSIASPLFKWTTNNSIETIIHDSFGIDPNLSLSEKEKLMDNILKYADILSIDKIRIFSYLGKVENPVSNFVRDKLFEKIINDNHTFLLENEPVCTIYMKKHLEDFVKFIDSNNITNIKIWLDIANLIQVGEDIDESFLEKIAPHIEYLHIKDFIYVGTSIKYVPVGTGVINYAKILSLLNKHIPDSQDITISIETHAKNEEEKYSYSKQSVIKLREKLEEVKI